MIVIIKVFTKSKISSVLSVLSAATIYTIRDSSWLSVGLAVINTVGCHSCPDAPLLLSLYPLASLVFVSWLT